MKIINHSADSVRQIVPQDMSFLSDADQQIMKVIGGICSKMLGLGSTQALVMEGMTERFYTSDSALSLNLEVKAGSIYYDGKIYSLVQDATYTNTNWSTDIDYADTLCFKFTTARVAPSPVYDTNGGKTVYVHEELTCTLCRVADMGTEDTYVTLGNVRRMPTVATPVSFGTSPASFVGPISVGTLSN